MNVERDEALSRLAAGDLPEEEATRWRARIAEDPATAEAWAALQGLLAGLDELPLEAPPAELDARVLATAEPRPARWSAWGAPLVVAAIGLLVVGTLNRTPTSTVALGAGSHIVDGEVRVVIGPVTVDVDGRSLIEVGSREPMRSLVREPDPEERMKTAGLVLAGAAGGAAVTVLVLQGTAHVRSDEVARLTPGQRLDVPAVASPGVRVAGARAREGGSERASGPPWVVDLATARTRIAQLEAENRDLRQGRAIADGQLTSLTGEPQPWTDDVPEPFRPDAVQERLDRVLAEHGELVGLAELDCAEFPCIAVFEPAPGVEWPDDRTFLDSVIETLQQGLTDTNLSVNRSVSNSDEGRRSDLAAVTMTPTSMADEGEARRAYRQGTLLEVLSESAP